MSVPDIEAVLEGTTEEQHRAFHMCLKDSLATMDQTLHFHNGKHTMNVFDSVLDFTSEMVFLSRNDVVMLSLVALLHDAGHSGISNHQHAIWNTSIYKIYGGVSTNEYMHADIAITILRKHNMFNLFPSDIDEDMVRNIILSTDIMENSRYMKEIKKSSSREHLYMLIIKAADISHTIHNFEECSLWAKNINAESGHIFDPQNEVKFISNISIGLCARLLEMVPCDKFNNYLLQVRANIECFETMI